MKKIIINIAIHFFVILLIGIGTTQLVYSKSANETEPKNKQESKEIQKNIQPTKKEEKDLSLYLDHTKNFVDEKKYDIALQRYEWLFENALDYNKSFIGVRNSFLLFDWYKLAEQYEPAMQSLYSLRDKEVALLMSDAAKNKDSFGIIISINENLQENDKSIALYEKIITENPNLTSSLFLYIDRLLLKEKKYDIISKAKIDPKEIFDLKNTKFLDEISQTEALTDKSAFEKHNINIQSRNDLLEYSVLLMQYCIYTNDTNSLSYIVENL